MGHTCSIARAQIFIDFYKLSQFENGLPYAGKISKQELFLVAKNECKIGKFAEDQIKLKLQYYRIQ